MANILDIRRRIRSVKNTRQITKAMKMVAAAKLRRAQDRALSSRPFAQMLTNVLKSLVQRAEVVDPETGQPRHPLLARREENNVLVVVVTGDKGLAGAFNTNLLKATVKFLAEKRGRNVDIEAVGRKGRDFLRRRFPMIALPTEKEGGEEFAHRRPAAERKGPVQIVGEHIGILGKVGFADAQKLAEQAIERYTEEEIDAVYVIYNEFKSVIAQRLVVEQILPIERIGEREIRQAEEFTQEERARAKEAAISAGVGMRPPETGEIDRAAA